MSKVRYLFVLIFVLVYKISTYANYGKIIKVCNSSKSISFHLKEIRTMYSINNIIGGGDIILF